MARIPNDATPEVQACFRQIWEAIDSLTNTRVDFKGVVLGGVGRPIQADDAANKQYVDDAVKKG